MLRWLALGLLLAVLLCAWLLAFDPQSVRAPSTRGDGASASTPELPASALDEGGAQADAMPETEAGERVGVSSHTVTSDTTRAEGLAIRGLVVDLAGNPAPDAQVTVRPYGPALPGDGSLEPTRCYESGCFRVDVPRAGTWQLHATAGAWAASDIVRVQVNPRAPPAEQRLVLQRCGRITGECFDADGRPDAGRNVTVFGARIERLVADEHGRFEVGALLPGSYRFRAQVHAGEIEAIDDLARRSRVTTILRESLRVELAAGETAHVVIGLPPARAVRLFGTVANTEGIPGVLYVNAWPHARGMRVKRFFSQVGDRGQYEMVLDAPGTYTVTLNTPDVSYSAQVVEVPEQESLHLDLALGTGRISGRIVASDGSQVGAVHVRIAPVAASSVLAQHWQPELKWSAGGFELRRIPAGAYTVTAIDLGHRHRTPAEFAGGAIELREGEVRNDIELRFAPDTSVRLTIDGAAAGEAFVFGWVGGANAERQTLSSRVIATGVRLVENLPPGRWSFGAERNGDVARPSEPVEIAVGGSVDVALALAPGAFVTAVLDGVGAREIECSLSVVEAAGRVVRPSLPIEAGSARRRGDGCPNARLGPLSSGRHTLIARVDGRVVEVPFEVRGAEDLEVRLDASR